MVPLSSAKRLLRIHLMPQCYSLSDLGMDEALIKQDPHHAPFCRDRTDDRQLPRLDHDPTLPSPD